MRVKICGITNMEDALQAAYNGAWALGFIFYKKSPRYVSPSKVRKIVEQLPPFVTPVGVFVDSKPGAVKDICQFTRIHTIQLHGDEDPNYCKNFKNEKIIKAFRVSDKFDFSVISQYKVDAFLFDTFQENAHGGSGKTFNWNMLEKYTSQKPYILSGGLTVKNLKNALEQLKPFALDVSSGVEKSPGVKDSREVRAFIDFATK